MKSYDDIDSYISSQPAEAQNALNKIRSEIKRVAPDTKESINYGIPTFKQNGKNLVHFASYKSHVGFYPGAQAIEDFKKELTPYKTSKGTIQFPLDRPIPYELIIKITESLLK